MSINEKKALYIDGPGSNKNNVLPATASFTGYDLNTQNYIYYDVTADTWKQASSGSNFSQYWQSDAPGNIFTTGSIYVSGSMTGSNLILTAPASRILAPNGALVISSSAGTFITGSLIVSGTRSDAGTDNTSVLFNGDLFVSGGIGINDYIQLKPVNLLRIPTNTTASYVYTSGSTNDLYFTQYNGPYTNTTRLRWLESTLTTGLLYGGVLSTANGSTTFSMTSGSGLIVSYNASTTTDPYPTIQLLQWPAYVSQSLTYVSSSQISYIGINSSGGIIQRTTPFGAIDYETSIPIGRVLHQSGSVTNGTITSPHVSYGLPGSHDVFVRAFGPLKLSGHVLAASGSTLGLTKTGGDSYVEGRNYTSNPSSPDLVLSTTDFALTGSKIYREYVSGSTPVIDTGVGTAGYTTINPGQYNNNGTLASVPNNNYSIQRVYWFPNSVNRALFVYYGTATYGSIASAQSGIADEIFIEGANTAGAAILVGYIIVREDATNLSDATRAKIIQAPLFRAAGGGGVAGGGTTTPGGLDTYVQFNDGGSTFGGVAGLTFNKVTNTLSTTNLAVSNIATVSGSVILGDAASDVVYVSGSVTASNGLLVNVNGSNIARFNAGGLQVTGSINGSSTITATTGFSGSLTRLTDGTSYIIAGPNITLTTGSNGAITIAASALAASGSSKNVIYVAKDGSNSSVSGSVNSPFLTIQGAINYIEGKRPSVYSNTEDVVILVAPGTYSEDITFTKPFINVMGYVPTQYSKATQLSGLVNINNTSNPGGGTGQTFGIYNFLITAPTTASANVISFSGTGNGSLVLENMQVVGGGSNQSILYVSKSAAVATNCRVKVLNSIFNTETAGSAGPTANIFNVYSVFESCEITYGGSVSGGTALNTNNATVDFLRGTLAAGTSNSIVSKITGSSLTPLTVGDTAVLGTSTGTNGFLLAPGATFVSGKNAFSIATGTTFVVSGSATSNFVTAFDGILAGGILYNNRISNTMTTTFVSASYTKVT